MLKKVVSLQSHFGDKVFCGIKESVLLLVKSPNLNKEYTRHGAAHIRGLPIRVVYSGVWRYLQENTEGSPLSLTINIVKSPSWLSAEKSCKIRHYESLLESIFRRSSMRNTCVYICSFLCRRNVTKHCYCKDDQ